MSNPRNPQAREMADESMVRNLDAQARAIWPQEQPLFASYPLPADARILDLGCGTGEITSRLASMFPRARIVGADLEAAHLRAAAARCAPFGGRVRFMRADAFELPLPDSAFDMVVNRHMLQAVPDAPRVVAEAARVLKPGGRIHLLVEDYSMMHFWPVVGDSDEFWRLGPIAYAAATGSDLKVGRKAYTWLRELGFHDARVDYVVVDTVRVDRELFASIWVAWRDGYTDTIARHTTLSREAVRAAWDDMIAAIRHPHGYAIWQVPIITGLRPARA